jgi:histidyl-tRNA synthetase
VADAFQEVARVFNFRMMEPATLEHLSTLRAKSGSDVDKEIYSFKDKGGRDVGLRFDLTVGMTRYVCAKRGLKLPVKLGAFAGAWRYDEPQHARYRWFRQWDLELFDQPSAEADAEVIEASSMVFKKLGMGGFTVNVGDRAAVQSFIEKALGVVDEAKGLELLRALDKTAKRSLAELRAEYGRLGFPPETLDRLFEFGRTSGPPEKVLATLEEQKVDVEGLAGLADALAQRGVKVRFSMGVVRGLDYYTGVVFEVADDAHPELGSLAGGGRYDFLPRAFGRDDLSATGAAGGVERIALSLDSKRAPAKALVYVAYAGMGSRGAALRAAGRMRDSGVAVELPLRPAPLGKQLDEARRLGAAFAAIVGEREESSGTVTLRDLRTGVETSLGVEEAVRAVGRHEA